MIDNKALKQPRNSAIELLRIISMIMIIFHHFALHGKFVWTDISLSRFWYNFIYMGGKVGVDVFILISGYFLIADKGPLFNVRKIIKLIGEVLFYSIVIFVIFWLFGYNVFDDGVGSLVSIIYAIFPITFSKWWFVSAYFVLYLIHPFLNKLLLSINKRKYQTLIILLVIMWSVIPTFLHSSYASNDFIWFVTLYIIAGYARIYGFNSKLTTKSYAILWIIFSFLTYLSTVVLTFLSTKWSFIVGHEGYFAGQEKISTLLISLSLFMMFATMKMKYHKWINVIASATFGVYLIHDHPFVRSFLWMDLFKNASFANSLLLIPYSIFAVFSVYLICTIIDLLRQYLIERPVMSLVNKYADTWMKPVKKICRFFENIVFGKEE